MRWEVTLPLGSVNRLPSGLRIKARNWWSSMLASTAKDLPYSALKDVCSLLRIGVSKTPNTSILSELYPTRCIPNILNYKMVAA